MPVARHVGLLSDVLCCCAAVLCVPSWVTALTVVETDVGMVVYAGDSVGGLSVWTKVAPGAEGEEGALAGSTTAAATSSGLLGGSLLPAPLSHSTGSTGSLAAYSHVRAVPGKSKVCFCAQAIVPLPLR